MKLLKKYLFALLPMDNEITIDQAVKRLKQELRNDKHFYESYQSNIAMAFYVELKGYGIGAWKEIHESDLSKSCNNAADNFLKLLMSE